VFGVRFVVEAAVGEGTAEALVEKQEQQRDVHALGGEAIGIATAIALEKSVAFELAKC